MHQEEHAVEEVAVQELLLHTRAWLGVAEASIAQAFGCGGPALSRPLLWRDGVRSPSRPSLAGRMRAAGCGGSSEMNSTLARGGGAARAGRALAPPGLARAKRTEKKKKKNI